MTQYEKGKARTRAAAMVWQLDNSPKSYGQVAEGCGRLRKLARRYGLIKELQDNAII